MSGRVAECPAQSFGVLYNLALYSLKSFGYKTGLLFPSSTPENCPSFKSVTATLAHSHFLITYLPLQTHPALLMPQEFLEWLEMLVRNNPISDEDWSTNRSLGEPGVREDPAFGPYLSCVDCYSGIMAGELECWGTCAMVDLLISMTEMETFKVCV